MFKGADFLYKTGPIPQNKPPSASPADEPVLYNPPPAMPEGVMNILEPLEMVRETQNVNLNAAKTRYKDYNLFIMNLAPLCPKPNFGPSGCKRNKRPDY